MHEFSPPCLRRGKAASCREAGSLGESAQTLLDPLGGDTATGLGGGEMQAADATTGLSFES